VTLINPGATLTSFFDADGGPPDRAMLTANQLASCIVWAITSRAASTSIPSPSNLSVHHCDAICPYSRCAP
jgi:short-subunit dehydrogenase